MSPTAIAHVYLDDHGVAWIDSTKTKVIEVVLDKSAHGWSPEEIHFQHRHLTLAQIYAALAYYYDHQSELDADIERRHQYVEQLRTEATGQITRAELEARLHQPATRKSA